MPTKHCCNQTSKGVKSSVYPQGKETMLDETGAVAAYQVNNPNYLAYIDQLDTPVVYFGADHLPCGTSQFDPNPTP
jgi:hypothetical protein